MTNHPNTPVMREWRGSTDIRLYKRRASYSLQAALDIFKTSPIAHIAFIHPGTGHQDDSFDTTHGEMSGNKAKTVDTTVMNVPMVTILMRFREDDDEDEGYDGEDGFEEDQVGDQSDYSVYLHT